MTIPYICNQDQIAVLHVEKTKQGEYHFIRKIDEKNFNSYRKLDNGGTEPFYVQTPLPPFLFKELIASGKVQKHMYS